MTRRISVWATAAAVAILGCSTTRSSSPATSEAAAPGSSKPAAVSNDSDIKRSMAEGGPQATGFRMAGVIDQVGTDHLMVRSQTNGDEILHVRDGTTITLNGNPASLADLKQGMPVRASYDAEFNAQAVEAFAPPKGAQNGQQNPAAGSFPGP